MHCPLCGHIDSSDKWWTKEQINQIQENAQNWAVSYIQGELEKTFKRRGRLNKYIQVTYKPGQKVTFINNPIGQREEWQTEICCEKCGTHYSVIGSAYFCPCCGYNSAINSFNDSLDSIQRMIESLPDIKSVMADKYNIDAAEIAYRSSLEDTIGNMISAFQKFASCKYDELSGKASRVNDFQIVEKGSRLFHEETGKSYSNWLSADELFFMNVMFQQRHLLEHNNGIVDQKYLDKSKDDSYTIGQRVVVKEVDAYKLLSILKKLGNEIINIQKGDVKNVNR